MLLAKLRSSPRIRRIATFVVMLSFCVGIADGFLFFMPLDAHIIYSQRFSPNGEYNTPISLKGRTFYVTLDERDKYKIYETTFITSLFFSALLMFLFNLTDVQKNSR
jgi:hypothetical protein